MFGVFPTKMAFFHFGWQHMGIHPRAHSLAWGHQMGSHTSFYGLLLLLTKKHKKIVVYSTTTTKYGHQIRVQLYFVAKHSLVHEDMEHARPNVYKIYLTSSSMHNHVKFLFIIEIVFFLSNNFF
jgi:hypothetical protein